MPEYNVRVGGKTTTYPDYASADKVYKAAAGKGDRVMWLKGHKDYDPVTGKMIKPSKTKDASLDTKISKDAEIKLPKNVTSVREGLAFLAEAGEKSGLATAIREWDAWQSAPADKAKAPSKASRALIKKIASRNSRMAGAVAGPLALMENKYG